MSDPVQVGGSYHCKKCGEYTNVAETHECPTVVEPERKAVYGDGKEFMLNSRFNDCTCEHYWHNPQDHDAKCPVSQGMVAVEPERAAVGLLPCPFCGEVPTADPVNDDWFAVQHAEACYFTQQGKDISAIHSIRHEGWNTRAQKESWAVLEKALSPSTAAGDEGFKLGVAAAVKAGDEFVEECRKGIKQHASDDDEVAAKINQRDAACALTNRIAALITERERAAKELGK